MEAVEAPAGLAVQVEAPAGLADQAEDLVVTVAEAAQAADLPPVLPEAEAMIHPEVHPAVVLAVVEAVLPDLHHLLHLLVHPRHPAPRTPLLRELHRSLHPQPPLFAWKRNLPRHS
jgi:hypothetical protein